MYVYVTAQCEIKAEKHGIMDDIEKISNAPGVIKKFDPITPYFKKKINNNFRLVAKVEKVDGDRVLCLLEIFKRGDKEYQVFLDNRDLESLLNHDELRQWLKEQKESGKQQQNQLPNVPLPAELREWLNCPSWRMEQEELVIYESKEWVSKYGQSEIKMWNVKYHEMIYDIVEGRQKGETMEQENVKLLSDEEGPSVLYWRGETIKTEKTPAREIIFLLAPFANIPSDQDIKEVVQKTKLGDNADDSNLKQDDLARSARRSYPSYMVYDTSYWLKMETDEDSNSNLALSGEEEWILESVSTPGNLSLPMFINGRAGSGKSTMLFYLFAYYCDLHFKECDKHGQEYQQRPHPLFITYSKKLLDEAERGVEEILKIHHKFLAAKKIEQPAERPNIEKFFHPFHEFIKDLLPAKERERFDNGIRISFYKFRQEFENSRLREADRKKPKTYISPELGWHAIRTFIKGYSLEYKYMDPDSYQEVPGKEQTISEDTYQRIYDTIWKWYKKLTKERDYWDDQDLIRKVLELECYRPEYTAIFCDESQDFTRLELRLIMKLSDFSKYELGYEKVQSLPFAFAGDPFQTLNPTGFRWESVQASFYNEVIMKLDPAANKLNMNFQPLKYNYRSKPPIVKFTNLIQLWRRRLFNLTELQPQEPWEKDDYNNVRVQKFILDQDLSTEKLGKHITKDPLFILPCEASGESEYVTHDEVLKNLFKEVKEGEEGEEPPKNVLSAIQAKGLESEVVILYKFGDELAKQVDPKAPEALWDFSGERQDKQMALEYFFNKLYVAASRAMCYLVIIDSEEGDELLWKYASAGDPDIELDRLGLSEEDREIWGSDNIRLISEDNNLEVLDQDDREENAKELKRSGERDIDPVSLRKAKRFFKSLGNYKEEDICEALALKFEKHFSEAGKLFLKRNEKKEAGKCFWEGTCWLELKDSKYSGEPVEPKVVDFMTKSHKSINDIDDFTKFLEELSKDKLTDGRKSKAWQEAVKEYAATIESLLGEENIDRQKGKDFGNMLADLDNAGYARMLEVAGSCFYKIEEYEKAVEHWEKCEDTKKREYNLAKAELSLKKAGEDEAKKDEHLKSALQYLRMAAADRRILDEWEKLSKPCNKLWHDDVILALKNLNQYQELVDWCLSNKLWIEAIEAVDKCPSNDEKYRLKIQVVKKFAESYIKPENKGQNKDYQRYVELIEEAIGLSLSRQNESEPENQSVKRPQNKSEQEEGIYNWQKYLSVWDVGTALEKIGDDPIAILRFYEYFLDDSDYDTRTLARNRWLATKKKQANNYKNNNKKKHDEAEQEFQRKAREWDIDPNSLFTPLPQKRDSRRETPEWEKVKGGMEQCQIEHLEVTRHSKRNWILVTDNKTEDYLEIYLSSGQHAASENLEDKDVKELGSNRKLLNVSESGYNAEWFYGGNKPRLELEIEGISNKIEFTLDGQVKWID